MKSLKFLLFAIFLTVIGLYLIFYFSDTIYSINRDSISECQSNADCFLINENNKLDCNDRNYCGSINYSLGNFISVNKGNFLQLKRQFCLFPHPLFNCPSNPENLNYTSQCIQSRCEKIKKEG